MARSLLHPRRAPAAALAAVLLLGACRDVILPTTGEPEDELRPLDAGALVEDAGAPLAQDAGHLKDGGFDEVDDAGAPGIDDGGTPTDASAPGEDAGPEVLDAGVDLAELVSIAIAPIASLPIGRDGQLQAIGTFSDTTTADVTEALRWSSLSPACFVSDLAGEQGSVHALSLGTATIQASTEAGDVVGAVDVFVVAAVREELTIDPPATSAPLGVIMQLRALVRMSDDTIVDVTEDATWTSVDPTIADVSDVAGTKGRVEALGDGVATIDAVLDDLSEQALVTVLPAAVVSVAVAPPSRSVAQGRSTTFTATAVLTDGASRDATADVTWTSLDVAIAIPEAPPGTFRTLAQGAATIEARYGVGGPAATGTVTVTAPVLEKVTAFDKTGYAVYSHGVVRAWGRNTSGQLGVAASLPRTTPLEVANATDVVDIVAGANHVLALRRDGTVLAWGRYQYGQLGDGRTTTAPAAEDPFADPTPGVVVGLDGTGALSGVVELAAGMEHSLALLDDGRVVGWGRGLCNGLGTSSGVPRVIEGIPPAVSIGTGGFHSLIADEEGHLWAFGWNVSGQLGQNDSGDGTDRYAPTLVKDAAGTGLLSNIVAASGGYQHTIALAADGAVWCFGHNDYGECGVGDSVYSKVLPVRVKGIGGTGLLTGVSRIEAGSFFNTATLSTGALLAWGLNYNGELAAPLQGTTGGLFERATVDYLKTSTGAQITNVRHWAGAGDWGLLIRTTGATLSWGANTDGQLGDGTTTGPRSTPAAIQGL